MLSAVTFDSGSSELNITLDGSDSATVQVIGDQFQVAINGSSTGPVVYTDEVYFINVTGGPGNNSIDLSSLMTANSNSLLMATSIQGGSGDDTITGSGLLDFIDGGEGDDSIHGGPGDDDIIGGPGHDTLNGDEGTDDLIQGGTGDDMLWSGSGAPDGGTWNLFGGTGFNLIDGVLEDGGIDPLGEGPEPIEDPGPGEESEEANTPPVITGLVADTSGSGPAIQWVVSDETPHEQYDVDIDVDGDGQWDLFVIADGQLDADMQEDLTNAIGRGTHTLSVRPVEYLDETASDPVVLGEWVSVTLTTNHNRLPSAADDTFQITNEGPQVDWTLDPTANDTDPDGDALSVSATADPEHGTIVLDSGTIKYTPDSGFSGDDSFAYTLRDSEGGTATGTITVWVDAIPPDVQVIQLSDLSDDAEYDLLHAAAVEILGEDLGTALINEQGRAAARKLVTVTSWGWHTLINGSPATDYGLQIDTVSQTIRVADHYYEGYPDGTFNNIDYTYSEQADQLNDLLFHEQVTQFNRGFDFENESPTQAFTNEFLSHPGARIAGGVAVAALAVATGGLSLPATTAAFSAAGLVEATVVVGTTYAVIRASDESILAAGEWAGVFESGDRTYGEAAIDYLTGNANLTDDLITATDLSVTIVELGAGGFLFFKGKRIPAAPPGTRPAANIVDDVARIQRNYCFTRDTPVQTADGARPIGKVSVGDEVYAFDFTSGEWVLRPVVERHDSVYDGPVVTVQTESDSVNVTAYHPFWVFAGRNLKERPDCHELDPLEDQGQKLKGRWVNSHDLRAGDVVYDRNGLRQTVRQVSQIYDPEVPVSNLTIKGLHNYAVGHAGILVHNTATWCGEAVDQIAARITRQSELDTILRNAIDDGIPRNNLEELIDAVKAAKNIDPSASVRAAVTDLPTIGLVVIEDFSTLSQIGKRQLTIFGENGLLRFDAVVEKGTGVMEIIWIEGRQTALSDLSRAISEAGEQIHTVKGYATSIFGDEVASGSFNPIRAAKGLKHLLEGDWAVDITRDGDKLWVIATRGT